MAHLGADVAAFVDGQLSPDADAAARQHLAACERCRSAVVAQEDVKARMERGLGASPAPPPALMAALAGLADVPVPPDPWRERVLGSRAVRASVAVVSASLAVLVAAYLVGGYEERDGDPVSPAFDRLAADFLRGGQPSADHATTASFVTASAPITDDRFDELASAGWPCHEQLGGLERVGGHWREHDAMAIDYTDGRSRLMLVEQAGALDTGALEGFDRVTVDDAHVWMREGEPRLVSWDSGGVVYTIVTDADDSRLAAAIDDLPTRPATDVSGRIGTGLDRLTGWAAR